MGESTRMSVINVKITIIGDLCANKTQFSKSYQNGSLYLDNILGESNFTKALDIDGRKFSVNIFDISRQEGKDYVCVLNFFINYQIVNMLIIL